jgi:hypothetical protein
MVGRVSLEAASPAACYDHAEAGFVPHKQPQKALMQRALRTPPAIAQRSWSLPLVDSRKVCNKTDALDCYSSIPPRLAYRRQPSRYAAGGGGGGFGGLGGGGLGGFGGSMGQPIQLTRSPRRRGRSESLALRGQGSWLS